MEVAIYGKGGIGKSTITSNISVALASMGKKVLQFGCDPKQDSTRLLLEGNTIPSILEYIKDRNPEDYKLEDLIYEGVKGISCVEAGGPEPGVGCAGRGILTSFELLNRLGLMNKNYDIKLYDVLGDVVCGGFAVPIRKEYAKKIYIVSSGEFMSIYAANNILRGIKNYQSNEYRAGGIIYNSRNLEEEEERINRFSRAVGLPIIARIPRSELFSESEKVGQTVVEKYPKSHITKIFLELADKIYTQDQLYDARPIETDKLEELVLGFTAKRRSKPNKVKFEKVNALESNNSQIYSKNLVHKEPLHGCAFSGASGVLTQIRHTATIAHGPDSCSHITYQNITSLARRLTLERGTVLALQTSPPYYSSGMDESVMIFGGLDNLKEKISEIKKLKPKIIFILTTCPSGIIGENVDECLSLTDKETEVIVIKTDGNIEGDYLQGILMAYRDIALNLIDRSVKEEKGFINIIGEKSISDLTEYNFKFIKNILSKLGLKVNCRYIHNTDYISIKNFLKAELNLPAYSDYMSRKIEKFLKEEYDIKFFPHAFPIGFDESRDWLKEICTYFSKGDKFTSILGSYEENYRRYINFYKENLQGKKVMIVSYNQNIDWILKTILDLGMEIIFLGVLDFSQEDRFFSNYLDRVSEFHLSYDSNLMEEDLDRIDPDVVLSNYISSDIGKNILVDRIPLSPAVGFYSGLYFAKRWSAYFHGNIKEGWKEDEDLFRKYFS